MWLTARQARVLRTNIQSKMKIMRNILLTAFSFLLLSCSGNVDDSALPVLEVSDTEIDLASETSAVFTVKYNGVDVTGDAEIFSTLSTMEFDGTVFTPVNTGSAAFTAEYDGKESNTVIVNVINSKPQVESRYDRHVCVMEFTGASCAFCPAGYDLMMGILSNPSMSPYRENIHICAFHSEEMGPDTLAIDATSDVKKLFGTLELPSFAVDMRDSGVLSSDGSAMFRPAVMASFDDYPAHCGVAVSSDVISDGRQARVEVGIASDYTTEYRVVLLVVQNKITGYQKHGSYGELDDYMHNHVVRKVITSYTGTFTGEKITEDGVIPAGDEASSAWTIDIDDRWVIENTYVYALALDRNGYVNNMNVCPIDGGNSSYDIK